MNVLQSAQAGYHPCARTGQGKEGTHLSNPGIGRATHAPRIRRSRSGWTWKACLAPAVLACAFAGAAQAQTYQSLDLALGKIIGELVDDGELRGRTVFVSPNHFTEMGTGRNLRLSELLANKSIPVLTLQGARVVSGSEDEDRVITLRGEWSIEPDSEHLYLFMEVKQLVGNNERVSHEGEGGLIPLALIDGRYLEPDIESHGRYVVRRLERNIAGAGGRYRLHVRPFTARGMAEPERFNRYLLGRWRPAFADSRRLRLVGSTEFDGELHGDVYVVGGHIEVSLYIRDNEEEVAAATVEMDKGLFPSDLFGPDVTAELAECAGLVEAGRLGAAKGCYEGVRAGAPGDADAVEGVRAGLERIAEMESARAERARAEEVAVRGVRDAIGRGEFGEARKGLERLRELNAGHPRLAELEGEIVRAEAKHKEKEREERLRAERERKAHEAAARREWEERKRADDAAYARAESEGTAAAYERYLSSCAPLCGHAAEARRLKAETRRKAEAERRAREEERQRAEAEERRRAEAERWRRAWPPGMELLDCYECPKLVVVPSGSYWMGSERGGSNEQPVHEVRIGYPLAVGVYEVTFGEWDACVLGGGCGGYWPDDEGRGRGRRPVVNVSWDDAQAYVGWLSRKTGEEYRLLSESEWEYVARAGTRTRYWWGDEIGRNRANCLDCKSRWDISGTAPVGLFSANGFGLHDVHGNVEEWVEDCWNGSYRGAPTDGSAWESENCNLRALRGGSWFDLSEDLRSAIRSFAFGFRDEYRGFRVARTLTP